MPTNNEIDMDNAVFYTRNNGLRICVAKETHRPIEGKWGYPHFSAYPAKIIFNGPACIVIWADGEKTIIKKMNNEEWDPYAAVAQALAKKIYGSTSHFHKLVDDNSKYQYPKGYLTEEGCYV